MDYNGDPLQLEPKRRKRSKDGVSRYPITMEYVYLNSGLRLSLKVICSYNLINIKIIPSRVKISNITLFSP